MRLLFLLIFFSCIGLLSYAQYLQQIEGLLPCPLCVAQRIAYWLLGLTALVAFLHNPRVIGRRVYGLLLEYEKAAERNMEMAVAHRKMAERVKEVK